MKNSTKSAAVIAGLLMCFSGYSQKKPEKKPIKSLVVFDQSDVQPNLASRQSLFSRFDLSSKNSFQLKSTKTDRLGVTHQNFQQLYKGIPVEFSSSAVNIKNGQVTSMVNNVFRIKALSVDPKISAQQALNTAIAKVGAQKYLWENQQEASFLGYAKPKGKLVILPSLNSEKQRLAYKFNIYATQPLYRADVYIDAQTGEFIMENKIIHHAGLAHTAPATTGIVKKQYVFPAKKAFYADVNANGQSLYNGVVNFYASSYGSGYSLNQTSYGQGVNTYDMNNGTNYNQATTITSGSTTFSHSTGVQAHFAAEQTYLFYQNEMNRNSFDGNGAAINSYVSYKSNYVNAFWDGQRMTYGDGDGVNYGPLVSLDIVGHELTHAVTQYSAGLVYQNEPGALNESFSDIMGETIEYVAQGNNDWLMGDQIGAGGSGGALRSMSNPNAHSQPDTYLGQYWYSGSSDNGGVHTNSGVQNYWFYLSSVGGSGSNDNGDTFNVTGIGMVKAAKIAYRNLTVYLTSYSTYADARAGAIQAAIDLYGADSQAEKTVTNAWYAVGVGSAYNGGGTPPPSGDCITGDVYLSITFDNYPEETSWDIKDASGNVVASKAYSNSTADGSTINVTFDQLTAGDYTFTIYDQYGDGICCSYGNGSYTLSSDAGVIASGGGFGNSKSTAFCIEGSGGGTPPPANYCASNGQNASYEWIDLVGLNNLNHSSASDGGYADNTSLTANLPYGANTINLSTGFSGSSYTEYWAIWIDYDHNGTFESSEKVVSGSSTSSATLTGDFTVPNTATAGPTRMRVSMKYNSAQTPCEVFGYGEVEDYTVNIGQTVTTMNGIAAGANLGTSPNIFDVELYPNPVINSQLTLNMGDDRDVSFKIYDLSGRQITTGNFKGRETINVQKFETGVYLLKLNDGQKSLVKKFVKK